MIAYRPVVFQMMNSAIATGARVLVEVQPSPIQPRNPTSENRPGRTPRFGRNTNCQTRPVATQSVTTGAITSTLNSRLPGSWSSFSNTARPSASTTVDTTASVVTSADA